MTLMFVLSVFGLQQLAAHLGNAFHSEKEIIQQLNIDPAVFFYTESDLALEAEKNIRNKINE